MKKRNLVFGFMLIIILATSTGLMATNNCLDFDGTDDYVEATYPTLFGDIPNRVNIFIDN